MTQIAVTAGSNASVTITAGQKLLIGGQGTYRIGPLGTSQRPTVDELIDTMSTVGPFSDTCTVQIWATGSGATYEVFATTDAADQTGRPYSVSGAEITTSANQAALVAAGKFNAFFTDIGIGGSYWFYSGGRWRPLGGRVTLKNTSNNPSSNSSTKTVLDACALPPVGLWQDGDLLELDFLLEKTGGTSDTCKTDVLIGASAATPGSTLWDAANALTSGLATTTLTLRPAVARYRRESATTIRPLGINGGTGAGTSSAASAVKTVPNMDSQATYLQISSQLTTGGTETVWLRGFVVTLIAGS